MDIKDMDLITDQIWEMIKKLIHHKRLSKDGLRINYIEGKHVYRFKDYKGEHYQLTIEKLEGD